MCANTERNEVVEKEGPDQRRCGGLALHCNGSFNGYEAVIYLHSYGDLLRLFIDSGLHISFITITLMN